MRVILILNEIHYLLTWLRVIILSEDTGKPFNPMQFISFQVYDAIYLTDEGEEHILLEQRQRYDRSFLVYTQIQGREIRANSIHELVISQPDCLSITINHNVPIIWDTISRQVILQETFSPDPTQVTKIAINLKLIVDDVTYESTENDCVTEAWQELHEEIDPHINWHLKTCLSCNFTRPAFLFPTSDRDEHRCYRDVSEAFTEVQEKSKFASRKARYAGDYFVSAFHRCSAWEKITR